MLLGLEGRASIGGFLDVCDKWRLESPLGNWFHLAK